MSTDPRWSSLGLGGPLPPLEYSTARPDALQVSIQMPHGLSLTGTGLLMGQHLQGQIPEYSRFHTSVMSPNTAVPFIFQTPPPHSSTLEIPSEMAAVSSCPEVSKKSHEANVFPCEAEFAVGSPFEPMSLELEVDDIWAFLGADDKLD